MDNETEAAIQRSLEKLVVGRTSLIIAHRLSTVRHADVIYVIEAGRIVEAGTHDELVANGRQYAALWRIQTGEHLTSERGGAERTSPEHAAPIGIAAHLPAARLAVSRKLN